MKVMQGHPATEIMFENGTCEIAFEPVDDKPSAIGSELLHKGVRGRRASDHGRLPHTRGRKTGKE
jgi:hypothetical protein